MDRDKERSATGFYIIPDLFSLYSQRVMDELGDLKGVKFVGFIINNIRYGYDIVLIAD